MNERRRRQERHRRSRGERADSSGNVPEFPTATRGTTTVGSRLGHLLDASVRDDQADEQRVRRTGLPRLRTVRVPPCRAHFLLRADGHRRRGARAGFATGFPSDEVSSILERSALDMNATTGCRACPVGHDRLSGSGRLDVAHAAGDVAAGNYVRADVREPITTPGPCRRGSGGRPRARSTPRPTSGTTRSTSTRSS